MREHHTRILGDGFLSRVDQIPDDWAALGSVLSGLKHVSVLVVGDLMLDEYLYGAIDRISPEAPVGILNWRSQRFSLGGAANVANGCALSNARAARSTRWSRRAGPTICRPIGRPSRENPHGTEAAGCWVRLNG